MELGTIKSSTIEKNADGEENVRMLICEVSSPEDNQDIELVRPSGDDTNPSENDVVLILTINEAFKIGLLIDDETEPEVALLNGEKELYSKDGTTRKAKLRFKKDGELVLNDGSDFAVAFEKLQAKIDALEIKLLAHVHTGVTVGVGSTGPTSTLSFINIDDSKVEKVRL